MVATSFRNLAEQARGHDDYWTERAILEVTEEVVRRMEELKICRAELARRLGTSPAYVTKFLRGEANLTLATLARLGRALEGGFRYRLDSSEPRPCTRAADAPPGDV